MISVPEALTQAVEHHRAGQLQQAESLYRQILQVNPTQHDALHLLGLIAHQVGKNDVAETYIRESLRYMPTFAEAHNSLGIALLKQGRLDEAVASYETALLLKPDFKEARGNLASALNNLGTLLKDQGRIGEAIARFQQAISVAPDQVAAYCNLGHLLQVAGKMDEAEACLHEGLRVQPDFAPAHNTLGAAMQSQGRWQDAEACYRQAVRYQPDFAEAHKNLANVLHHQRRFPEAAECYQAALRCKPDFAEAHADLGILRLVQGDLVNGWPEYEWRWKSQMMSPFARHFPQPALAASGLEPASAKPQAATILLHTEQGFGDAMQFVRFAPLVKKHFETVLLESPRELVRLFKGCAGVDRVVTTGAVLPAFDVHAPLLSLPGVLGTSLDTIPSDIPYLFADADLIETWAEELAKEDTSGVRPFRIGIVWQGNPRQWDPQLRGVDRLRSIPLAQLQPLTQQKRETRLFSLQKGFGSEQIAAVSDRFRVVDLGDRLHDFMDTAAVMMNLDLVITVDSSPAHLAGALGVPVWVAIATASCWRWLLEREDTPWYPTMRLFRQKELNNWPELIERMAAALGELLAK